jgi:hypothetical protein
MPDNSSSPQPSPEAFRRKLVQLLTEFLEDATDPSDRQMRMESALRGMEDRGVLNPGNRPSLSSPQAFAKTTLGAVDPTHLQLTLGRSFRTTSTPGEMENL